MAEINSLPEIRSRRMLKDFLVDSVTNYNSSSGFKSLPPTLPDNINDSDPNVLVHNNLLDQAATTAAVTLPRSRSRSRAAAEAFGKLLNAVKSFHYSSNSSYPPPTPLTFPRSISRRFLGLGKWSVNKREKSSEVVMNSKIVVVTVKVKDILRWKSFRDLIVENQVSEEESQPFDEFVGPTHAPTSTSGADNFTVTEEELRCWSSGNSGVDDEEEEGENWDADDDVVVALDSEVGPKKDDNNIANEEETEQQSPVSVLESPFRDEISDNEEFLSSFDQSLAKMERTKQRLLQSIQLFESLAGVHEDDEPDIIDEEEEEEDEEFEAREEDNTREAKSKTYSNRGLYWFKRGRIGLEEKMECIRSMEKQRHWNKFEEEKIELGVEFEIMVLNDLLDEALIDFCV